MSGITGDMARLYDVFVDWEGRLSRELPGLLARLKAANAKRVLDVGCGTGRHVGALLKEGIDAYGADASADMLERAREHLPPPPRVFEWRMGEPPPADLMKHAPFDALICLGNTWPQVTVQSEVHAALAAFRKLVRKRGLLLFGLKAVALRRETGDPYLPLLRREHEGEPLWFIRFVEFDPADPRLCDFHMVVVRGDARAERTAALLHEARRMRVWSPPELEELFTAAGFFNVRVSARLDDPAAPPLTEDVFLHAFVA